jgi:mono/diheme cytochrome c family protein
MNTTKLNRIHAGTRGFVAVVMLVVMVLVAACGGGGSASTGSAGGSEESATSAPSGRVVPTMPAAQFAAPTTMIDATKVAEASSTKEPAEADAAFGGDVYTRLCADCHGEALEGVSGKAEPIETYSLDEAGLDDLLRTGGGYGNDHIFGPDKVSPEGIRSLQAYLETLGQGD